MTCFFLDLGYIPCEYRFDGMPDGCHLIPQQRLKAAKVKDLWAPPLWVYGCRRHHHLFDNKVIRLLREQYPLALQEWADDHGWMFAGPRDGWLKEAA